MTRYTLPPRMDLATALEVFAQYDHCNSYFNGDRMVQKDPGTGLSLEEVREIQVIAETLAPKQNLVGAEQAFLLEQLQRALKDKAAVAYGLPVSREKYHKPQPITAKKWNHLCIDLTTHSASGGGDKFVELEFDVVPDPTNHATSKKRGGKTEEANILRIFDENAATLGGMGITDAARKIREIAYKKWGDSVPGFDVSTIKKKLLRTGRIKPLKRKV